MAQQVRFVSEEVQGNGIVITMKRDWNDVLALPQFRRTSIDNTREAGAGDSPVIRHPRKKGIRRGLGSKKSHREGRDRRD